MHVGYERFRRRSSRNITNASPPALLVAAQPLLLTGLQTRSGEQSRGSSTGSQRATGLQTSSLVETLPVTGRERERAAFREHLVRRVR